MELNRIKRIHRTCPGGERGRKRRGLSAIEAAILFPLLILILFGVIEYSWMLLKSHEIRNASRHGARVGVLEVSTTAGVNAEVDKLMTEANLMGSGYTVTLNPVDPGTMLPGASFTVTVTVPYRSGITLTGLHPFLPMPVNLAESTTMLKEGAQTP